MKPTTPHDPLDDLIAAALHGELTPEERTQFDARLNTDPAARAAYQEAQLMHDLLEKTHQSAQPDPAFEQRMVSGVRRKIHQDEHRETAWESLLVLWTSVKRFMPKRHLTQYAIVLAFVSVVSITALISMGNQVKGVFTTISSQLSYAGAYGGESSGGGVALGDAKAQLQPRADVAYSDRQNADTGVTYSNKMASATRAKNTRNSLVLSGKNSYSGGTAINSGNLVVYAGRTSSAPSLVTDAPSNMPASAAAAPMSPAPSAVFSEPSTTTTPHGGTVRGRGFAAPVDENAKVLPEPNGDDAALKDTNRNGYSPTSVDTLISSASPKPLNAPTVTTQNGQAMTTDVVEETVAGGGMAKPGTASAPGAAAADETPIIDTRKLIRNAQLDLEVKSYQTAMDQITALTKAAGGYVDTSNSQKGGNGKLQGTVVVKVLPRNLDTFLFKLRDLGQLQNQSVSTDDVTKDYIDTMARLDNSRKMEAQLQDLLKRTNGKVSELLQVERELGRVRGEIEQMQGQLKLYDFQVQYATVTMNMRETDLNQAAAYLLRETDNFSLFATNVEEAFQQTRKASDDFKAHILSANLNHNSGSDVSAQLVVSVPPDQIEAFLAQLRMLGRVANFTRQTERVAKDGGDTDQPADQTLTDKDKVTVNISIRSDDVSRKQVAMTLVTPTVDTALDQAKTTALENSGEILSSALNKSQDGQSTGNLSVRIPGKNYHVLLDAYKTLGRTASFSLQREDNSGPGANGDDEPVIVSLALTDEEQPLQETNMSVLATDVDKQAQQLKRDAAAAGVQVKASTFEREPNGMEAAQMTFRLPMSKYPAFVESLKQLGHVEALTVNRVDRPDQTRTDDSAPAEISLRLHSQGDIVAPNDGFLATLRQTFGDGAGALFGSIRVIGVIIAFVIPWAIALGLIAWIGRRIYIWKKK